MINRAAVILRYSEPAIAWINAADPYGVGPQVTGPSVNSDRTVYLVGDEVADSDEALAQWIALNFEALFEQELEAWYTDESVWPTGRTLRLFLEWFEVECHSVLVDTPGR